MAPKVSIVSVLLVGALVSHAAGYSRGAPKSDYICKSMTPKHPGAPQSTESPYTLSLDKTDVNPGEKVTLTISGESFKGFLVQGRKINHDEDTRPLGKFVPTGANANDQQLLDCGYAGASITHNSPSAKSSMAVTWIAPDQRGSYVLL
jgi:hypothetical protein